MPAMNEREISLDDDLKNFVSKTLRFDWNPRGIDELPRYEYRQFESGIVAAILIGLTSEQIADILFVFENEYIGINITDRARKFVADKLRKYQ